MTQPRLPVFVAGAAFLAGLVALCLWLFGPAPVVEVPIPADLPPRTPDKPSTDAKHFDGATVGGTYEGRVVDAKGDPVRDADVLLVAIDGDAKVMLETYDADGNGQSIDVPIFGEYKTAARGFSMPDGSFSLAAGNARVVAIVAWRLEYSPAMVAHTAKQPLAPGPGHTLALALAGWLEGTVVDAGTQQPVKDVDVAIDFQGRANQTAAGPEPITALSSYSVFQTYLSRELGPLVWKDVKVLPGSTAFHVRTSSDGRFRFGPVMQEVQVEVVLTHPEYMWTDSDPTVQLREDLKQSADGKPTPDRRRRTVIPPGERVERVYALEKGKEIRGRVTDGARQPIPDVLIALEHVSQYMQHHRYRTTPRFATTDKDGRFRVAGLSFPPYNLRMTHPSFDTEWFTGVQDGSDVPYQIQRAGGWIELVVSGGPTDHTQWSARAFIETADRSAPRREEMLMVREENGQMKALIERVKPGKYDIFLVSGTKVSSTAQVDVRAESGATGEVAMGAGGGVDIAVSDASGATPDPVIAELEILGDGQTVGRRAATLVSRQGRVTSQGLIPGRYVAEMRSAGYIATRSEPFVVQSGVTTTVPAVLMKRQAFVRIRDVSGEDGRPLPGNVDVALYVAESGKEFERRRTLANGDLPVVPGEVMLKAESSDGRRFEQTLHPADGEIVSLEIRLAR